jgi:uncharacterized protein YeaO (DUF488 family)
MKTCFYTLSAYETTARDFFGFLTEHKIDLVLDVRLKNANQLCGFTKKKDLEYLVPALTHAAYVHDLRFAPEPELLEKYLNHWINWEQYKKEYRLQMEKNKAAAVFKKEYGMYAAVCILGTATKKRRSHSEVLEELLAGTEAS